MNKEIESIKKYLRLANYISTAQIYLMDNFLSERPLTFADIKPRLLGHWGTCPGINFVNAHLNRLIKKTCLDGRQAGTPIMFVVGPGHGLPAVHANLYLEGTLGKYYSEAKLNKDGLGFICKNFSWPYGFPSHSNPGTPGVIVEGGELGYALANAYGAALDNPELIVACLVGDGEAETGPTATAWHLNKFIDPTKNGVVLPILHLNGYKISGPTIFGRMSDDELTALFTGYGYEPMIVAGEEDELHEKMMKAMDDAHAKIQALKKSGGVAPKFPMIILRTLKGWTGIKELKGQKVEGNFPSHQVPSPLAKTDEVELRAVEEWLKSYNVSELFDSEKGPIAEIAELIPEAKLRMGDVDFAHGTRMRKALKLPAVEKFTEDKPEGSSSMKRIGAYLTEIMKMNEAERNLRIFSPDETYSNRLDAVFETTKRAWLWPTESWDKDLGPDGRVIEMLSEHSLTGMAQGYTLTGRYGIFASYEAFVPIVSSMTDQYIKFMKIARTIPWRGEVPSLNFILTSSGWRQEHNGFSHQNPGFLSNVLEKHGEFVKVYFPADSTSALLTMEKCLKSTNGVNVIAVGKTPEPQWLTAELARDNVACGVAVWDFASDENPDIIFSGIGDYMTKEAMAGLELLRQVAPEVKARFVGVNELNALGFGRAECKIVREKFNKFFTADKPVIFNFHGYPETVKSLLFGQENPERFRVHGYIEHGSITTPFDMQVRNETSRFHLVIEAVGLLANTGAIDGGEADEIIDRFTQKLAEHTEYIKKNGVDMPEIINWKWRGTSL